MYVEGPTVGIDCAMLYNPSLFTVRDVKLVPYVQELAKDSAFLTRGFPHCEWYALPMNTWWSSSAICRVVFSGSFYRESGARR